MASSPTTEASEVRRRGRQRLIGAIALVALLVVFVPMILDSEPRPQRADPTIPPKTNAPALPTPPAASPVAPAKAGAQAPATAQSSAPAPAKSAAQPPAPAKVEPKPAEPPKTAAAPKLEGFAVQVGAFRDEAKLDQARQKIAAAKVPHYTEKLDAKSGPLTRLRAGPFATREAAESALATLKRSALDGKVVPLP